LRTDKAWISLQRRPCAEHILTVLKEQKGEQMRFCDIKRALASKGWIHVDSGISHNIHWLADNGFIMQNDRYFYYQEKNVP
jgi:hypothetical protein